jgi:rod shape-determining protein MreB and related proteins
MLFSESVEARSALPVAGGSSWLQRLTLSGLQTWMQAPKFDAAVALGGSSVALTGPSGTKEFPALLAFNARHKCVAVGEPARALDGKEPEGVSIQQPLRAGLVHDPNGARLLLQHALKQAHWGPTPRLLLSVGSHPTALERETWEALGRAVGARQISLVSELLASAVGAGLDVLQPRCHMVLHIGSGRCEVGVIALGTCLMVRRGEVAGEDVTAAVQEYVRRTYHLLIHRQDADRLKAELTTCSSEAELPVSGRHLDSGAPLRVVLKAGELHPLVEGFQQQWTALVKQFLADIPIAWLDDIQDSGIHLTGGSSVLYGLSAALRTATGLRVSQSEQPQQCVPLGLSAILKSSVLRHALFTNPEIPVDDFNSKTMIMQRSTLGWTTAAALLSVTLFLSANSARALQIGGADPWLGPISSAVTAGLASGQSKPTSTPVLSLEEKRQLLRLRSENDRLWRWLGRRETNQNGVAGGVLARMVSRDSHPWLSGIRLDAGKSHGVKRGHLVMGERGLLGRVIQVDDHSCRVRLCLDPGSVVAGAIPRRKAAGVVQGKGLTTLEMRYLDPDSGVQVGDVVVTSGQDGQFPRGLPLGKVASVHRSTDSSFLTAEVVPISRLDEVTEVMVVR